MTQQKPIHCPKCGKLLDKRELNDGEIIQKYCPDCKINWVFVVETNLKSFKEYKKEEKTD
jgi:phage FluMu protein Com